MKQFETMSELDVLHFTNTCVYELWAREREIVQKYPDNEIAKFHMQRYWEMLEEILPEICRLEKEANNEKNKRA